MYGERIQSTLRQVAWNWKLTSRWSRRNRVEVRRKNTLWPGENVSFQGDIEASNWSAEKYFSCYARTPLKCKGIQDCLGIQIPRHGFRISGTEFQSQMVELGIGTPIVREIPDSKAYDSGFHGQNFPGFRIPQAKLLGFRNPDSPRWGDLYLGFHWRTGNSGTCETCQRHETRFEPLDAHKWQRT